MDSASTPPSTPCPKLTNAKNYTFHIQFLVFLAVVAMFLLHVLGSLRRRLSAGFLHAIVMGIYTLSYALVSYTIGLMQSSSRYHDEFAVWAVCLLLLLGSTDSLTACRLSDIDNWKSFFVRHIFQGVVVVWIMAQFGTKTSYQAPLWAILFVVLLKSQVRISSMRMATKSYLLSKEVKAITDYMHHEREEPLPPHDPVTMEGYRYVVAAAEGRHKYGVKRPEYMLRYNEGMTITTVEQIWGCTGRLLRHESRKDVCLSMALSKMLNRRFAGFELAEAGLPKTYDLVFRGLLGGDKPYERAFRVIEVELALVHDLYYTRYPYLYQKGRYLALYVPFIMLGLFSWLIVLIHKSNKSSDYEDLGPGGTIFILSSVAFLEAFQLYLYIASGWFKVSLIQSYVTSPFLQRSGFFLHMMMGFLLRLKALGAWEEKLGQYSFLSSFSSRSRCTNCFHYLTMRLLDKGKDGRKKKLVKLSVEVKKAIVDSLLESKGGLTNGVRSIRDHGHLSWACNESATRTIMVWHIATTLCKHHLDTQTKQNSKQPSAVHAASKEEAVALQKASTVASTLSGYCAYLVAFAPNLLPDHTSGSSLILTESINEARDLLKGTWFMKSRCKKLTEIGAKSDDNKMDVSLVELGARLARHLMEDIQEPTRRWKLLSDFWAEMTLYVAPSDDALGHLEALAKGGEFITHLWAMLTHAGILKQGLPAESTGMV